MVDLQIYDVFNGLSKCERVRIYPSTETHD